MDVRNLTLFVIAFALFQGCVKNKVVEPKPIVLTGEWAVYHKRYDDVVICTTYVTISQLDTNVCFLEEADTISTGIIAADTIRCGDMYQLGFSRIFIDDEDHMHSEIPMCESSNGLDFVREDISSLK